MDFEDHEERGGDEEEEEEEEEEEAAILEDEEDDEDGDQEDNEEDELGLRVKMLSTSSTVTEGQAAATPSRHVVFPGGGGGGYQTPLTAPAKPRYRECMKNHAVGIGGHAVDGCGEFLPAGAERTLDSLKCAACNCHRNFHRKELAAPTAGGRELFFHHHHHHHHGQVQPHFTPHYRTPPPPSGFLQVGPTRQHQHQPQHMVRPLALPSPTSGGVGGGHQLMVIDQEDVSNPMSGGGDSGGGGLTRKRFRTKFTQEQKEKMFSLAERLGWTIQKHDEEVVNHFCNETGVKRQVLKVWMHNNKHTLGKKP